VQSISIVDTRPPDITCSDDVTINCDESTDPSNTGTPVTADNCSDVTLSYVDQMSAVSGGCEMVTNVTEFNFVSFGDASLYNSDIQGKVDELRSGYDDWCCERWVVDGWRQFEFQRRAGL